MSIVPHRSTTKDPTYNIPEYHARGSIAPSRHFRPEYQPDRCGSRCTLSFSLRNEEETRRDLREKEMGEMNFSARGRETFVKTPSPLETLFFRWIDGGRLLEDTYL